jgi:hypothetical protein
VKFTAAKATFEQPNLVAAGTIDDNPETGWAIAGGIGKPQAITFDVAPDTIPPAGGLLVVVLDQQYPDGQHSLGKIRLSAIQEPVPAAPVAPAAPAAPAAPVAPAAPAAPAAPPAAPAAAPAAPAAK